MSKKKFNQKIKKPLTKEFLTEEYINKNKTSTQIMKENNLSASKVIKRLGKLGVKKPSELKFKKGNPGLKTTKALKKMYREEKLSIVQIAEKLNMTPGSVTSLFKRRCIPISKELRYERTRRNDKLRIRRLKNKTNIKKLVKEGNKQRIRKIGTRCKEETKLLLSEKAIDRGIKNTQRTKEEIKTSDILKTIKHINHVEQVGMKILENNKYKTGYIVDFLIPGKERRQIILEIDGFHHYKMPEIINKDEIENNYLCQSGFSVIRIKAEFANESTIKKSIELAKKEKGCVILKCDEKIEIIRQKQGKNNKFKTEINIYNHITKKVHKQIIDLR